MSELWELICHHTYSGTPGVIYDLSEGHGSHGQAVGIGASGFLVDGVSPGSGAVRVREDGQRIYIPPSASWWPLVGLRVQMTVRLDSQTTGLALHLGGVPRWLMSGYHFNFGVVGSRLHASFNQSPTPAYPLKPPTWTGPPKTLTIGKAKTKTSWGTDIIRSDQNAIGPVVGVPYDRWVTLGVEHDGLTTIELTIDGTPVARTIPRWPVLPEVGMCIGNTSMVEFPMVGAIDEVKAWRPDPDRLAREFFDRPTDEATRDCWGELLAWLKRWREANPDCAEELDRLIDALVREIAAGLAASPNAAERFGHVRRKYRDLWRANEMGSAEMGALLDGFASEMTKEGLHPERLDGHRRLMNSECYRRLRAEMPSPDCDPAFMAYLRRLEGGGYGAD